jgi:hypothetical protein
MMMPCAAGTAVCRRLGGLLERNSGRHQQVAAPTTIHGDKEELALPQRIRAGYWIGSRDFTCGSKESKGRTHQGHGTGLHGSRPRPLAHGCSRAFTVNL